VLKDPIDSARLYLHGLASLHLERTLPLTQVDALLTRFPLCHIGQGEAAFREGEAGNSALLVIRGMLEATVRTRQGDRSVGQVGPWDVVGETALYAPDRLRSATVRGRSETTCLRLDSDLLDSGENDVIAALEAHLLHTLSHRIRVTNLNLQTRSRRSPPPPKRQISAHGAYLHDGVLGTSTSTNLSACAGTLLAAHPSLNARVEDLEAILEMGELLELEAGATLCAQGEASKCLYFLLSGAILIDHQDFEGEKLTVGSESAPAILGHMGLIDRTRRGASCIARVPCRIIQVHVEPFWQLMRDSGRAGTALRRLLLSSLTRQLVDGNERIAGLAR
jgi:CRP-like cAMP-binding protein